LAPALTDHRASYAVIENGRLHVWLFSSCWRPFFKKNLDLLENIGPLARVMKWPGISEAAAPSIVMVEPFFDIDIHQRSRLAKLFGNRLRSSCAPVRVPAATLDRIHPLLPSTTFCLCENTST